MIKVGYEKKSNVVSYEIAIFLSICSLLTIKYVVFWKESVLMAHGAEVLFRLIETQYFSFNHGRIGMLPTQILPIILLKTGFALKDVVFAQSISYLIYDLFFVTLLFFWLKDIKGVICFIFFNTISSVYVYYTNEWSIFVAVNYCIVLWSYLNTRFKNKRVDLAIISILIFISLSSHPSTIILLFTILYQKFDSISVKYRRVFIAVILFTLISTIILDNYERGMLLSAIFNAGNISTLVLIYKKYVFHFSFLLLCIGFLGMLVINRRLNHRMVINISFIVLFFIYASQNSFSFLFPTSYTYFYFEGSVYTSICSFLILIFKHFSSKKFWYLLLILSIGRFFYLNYYNNPIKENIRLLENSIDEYYSQYPEKKVFVIHRNQTHIDLYNYYLTYQTYILSNILYGETIILYVTDRVGSFCEDGNLLFVNSFKVKEIDIEDCSAFILSFYPTTFFDNKSVNDNEIVLIH